MDDDFDRDPWHEWRIGRVTVQWHRLRWLNFGVHLAWRQPFVDSLGTLSIFCWHFWLNIDITLAGES